MLACQREAVLHQTDGTCYVFLNNAVCKSIRSGYALLSSRCSRCLILHLMTCMMHKPDCSQLLLGEASRCSLQRVTLQEAVSNSSSYVTSSTDGLDQSSSSHGERRCMEGEAEGSGPVRAESGWPSGDRVGTLREVWVTGGLLAGMGAGLALTGSGVPCSDTDCDLQRSVHVW